MDRKKIAWRDQAKAQLRAIDQPTALRILQALAHFAATGEGGVKRLQDIEPPRLGCASAKSTPVGRVAADRTRASRIVAMPRLGGMHHRYDLAA